MKIQPWYVLVIIPLATIIYCSVLFAEYPAYYTEDHRVGGDRRNPEPFSWHNNFSFVGLAAWDAPEMIEYQSFGFDSCEGNAAPAGINVSNDATCTPNINDTLAVKMRWRGRTRPPKKPTFKLKLYRCECDGAECEWKKYKIDNSSCILNTVPKQEYQGSATNEWTVRSDRHDFLNIYELFGARFFSFMGGRDYMWSTIVTVSFKQCAEQTAGCINQSMGMYQFTTSPEDDILPSKEEMLWKYDEGDHEPRPWGRPDLDLKEPDSCDDNSTSTDCTDESAAFIDVINKFENGSAIIDIQTFAARVWLQAMTSDRDYKRSLYFYTLENTETIYAGPAWDSGYAFNCPDLRCYDLKLAQIDGWIPHFYEAYWPYFDQLRPACADAWKARDVAAFIDDFEAEVRTNYTSLIRYDWELWRHVEDFECFPAVFQEETYSQQAGGRLSWKLENIDTQVDLFFEYLHGRHAFLNENHEDIVGAERKPSMSWGPLFVAFVTLTTLSIVAIAVLLVVALTNTSKYSLLNESIF